MNYRELESVVLREDVPKHHLRAGDAGTVVHVHSPDAIEVEFLRITGKTHAVVTLPSTQVRPIAADDVLAVRSTQVE